MPSDDIKQEVPPHHRTHAEALAIKEQRRRNHEVRVNEAAALKAERRRRHEAQVIKDRERKEAALLSGVVAPQQPKSHKNPPHGIGKAWRVALWYIATNAQAGDVDAKATLDAVAKINPRLVSQDFLGIPEHVLVALEGQMTHVITGASIEVVPS